jgi:hypothetical protein
MLKRFLEDLLTYLKYRITNTLTEGENSELQTLKSAPRLSQPPRLPESYPLFSRKADSLTTPMSEGTDRGGVRGAGD